MPVILWRNFVTSSWRLHSIFCSNHSHFWGIEAKFLKLLPYLEGCTHVSWIFWNFSLQVSPFLHSFWPIFSHFMHFYPFHLFFALFCLQNSRKYSKILENIILVAQFYNTSIFTSKASHSHIGGNIIFVRVLEDKHLRSHNMNIPSAYLSVWLHLGGWIVFDALTTLF